MRICLDASPVVNRAGGIGRYCQKLTAALDRLDEDVLVFVNSGSLPAWDTGLAHLSTLTANLGPRRWRLGVLLAHVFGRPQDYLFPGVDVFHATDHVLPRLSTVRSVFTLHDLTFRLLPETHTLLSRLFLSAMIGRSLRSAGALIAVSECTKQDAVRLYGADPAKMKVISLGVDPAFGPVSETEKAALRAKRGLPEQFVLALGTLEPRKNLSGLLTAYSLLRKRGIRHQLVIAGPAGWRYQNLFRRIEELGLQEQVVTTGYVPDSELPALYGSATVFVFPSLYEGFGLPVLEAMACGTPVVCSRTSSLPEVAGQAAVYCDPNRPTTIADAIQEVLDDSAQRQRLVETGLRRASTFSWEKTALDTLSVYRQVAG